MYYIFLENLTFKSNSLAKLQEHSLFDWEDTWNPITVILET